MELYDRIKARREELGMSQEELAAKMGYKSRSSVNKIELGKSDIPQSKISEFAIALQTSPAYLMGWVNDNNELKKDIESKQDLSGTNEYQNAFKPFSFLVDRQKGFQSVYRVIDEKNGNIFEKVAEHDLYDLLTFVNNNADFIRNEIYRRLEVIKNKESSTKNAEDSYLVAAHNDNLEDPDEQERVRKDLDRF